MPQPNTAQRVRILAHVARRLMVAAAATAATLLPAAPALAARFPAIINTGSELFVVGPLPARLMPAGQYTEPMMVGYKCQHLGLFWADIWTWDCRLVQVVSDTQYDDLPEDLVARLGIHPGFAFSQAQRGFWNHYAFWTPVAAFGALVLLALVRVLFGRQPA